MAACGGVSRTTLWRFQQKGFPQPIYLSARLPLWDMAEVRQWLEQQKRAGGAA